MFYALICVQIVLAAAIFFKISQIIYQKHLLTVRSLTKIGTFYMLWCVLSVKLSSNSLAFTFLWLQIPNLALFLSQNLLIRHREHKFRSEMIVFLSQLVCELKMGTAFRTAVKKLVPSFDTYFQHKLNDIMQVVLFSQHLPPSLQNRFLLKVIDNFKNIDTSPHHGLLRAEVFLDELKAVEYFCQKTSSILTYVHIQVAVMSLLFCAVLGFVVYNYGFAAHKNEILTSCLMFLTGLVWLIYIGRSFKWKT